MRFLDLFTFGKKFGDKLLFAENEKPAVRTSKIISFIICFVGLQSSFLLWGLMQERIIKYDYVNENGSLKKFKNSQFLVFSNRISGLILSFIIIGIVNTYKRCQHYSIYKIANTNNMAPLFVCSYSSLSNVVSSWFQYEALKYVSFTTQLLAKSSKSIFVMLVGRVVNNKKYEPIEYICVSIIAVGLYLFSDVQETLSDTDSIVQTTLPGIFCLLCYLISDSFTSNWQDNLLKFVICYFYK